MSKNEIENKYSWSTSNPLNDGGFKTKVESNNSMSRNGEKELVTILTDSLTIVTTFSVNRATNGYLSKRHGTAAIWVGDDP